MIPYGAQTKKFYPDSKLAELVFSELERKIVIRILLQQTPFNSKIGKDISRLIIYRRYGHTFHFRARERK